MKLHYRKIGSGQPLVILHGLFGASDNWQTIGKKLAEDYEVYLVDQRNHGHSPKSDDFSYNFMADDLYEMFLDENINDAILIGHSMGGKASILFGQLYGHLLDKLIIVDIGSKGYPLHHQAIFEGLLSVDLEVMNSRRLVDEHLSKYIDIPSVKQFLMKNLYWEEKGKLGWRINIPVLYREIENICGPTPSDEVLTDTLFIRGELSNYIVESDYDQLQEQFPGCEIETIANAGHWVHAENPSKFYEIVMEFID